MSGVGWVTRAAPGPLILTQGWLRSIFSLADRLTRFSLDESFTLTPQARSGLGKISDQPSCVQFRNMEPVGAKHAAGEHWGHGTDGLGSQVPSATP